MPPEEIHARRALRVLWRCVAAAAIAIVGVHVAMKAPAKTRADLAMYQEFRK